MSIENIEVGVAAPEITLRDQEGREVSFSSFWHERPTVFVFLRHFG